MAEKTLHQHLIESGWEDNRDADDIIDDLKQWLPSEAPSNPLNSSAYDYGFQLGYNAYRNEVLKNLQ